MKRYYLITLSWSDGEKCKIKGCKLFTDAKEALLEIANSHVMTNRSLWISEQIKQIKRDECSVSFNHNDIFKTVVTSDYPEKSKTWRHNYVIELMSATIIEAERDIKLDNILN